MQRKHQNIVIFAVWEFLNFNLDPFNFQGLDGYSSETDAPLLDVVSGYGYTENDNYFIKRAPGRTLLDGL